VSAITHDSLFKWLGEDGVSHHGGTGRWAPGRWRSVRGPLQPCVRGLHLCRVQDLLHWCAPALWLAEAAGERLDNGNKLVVRRARIVEPVETWNDQTAQLFAADCAEHVLPLFEQQRPGDDRPRQAIEAARAYTRSEIDQQQLTAAGDAAWDAAGSAAWAAAGDAAWAAARAAAWAAAWAAARAAAWAAARAAAWAAAWAARAAAWATAGAAAGDAAWATERPWQTERLLGYLRGEVQP